MVRKSPTPKKSPAKRTTTNKKASNRNYEGSWGETRDKKALGGRYASQQVYIDCLCPRCAKLQYMLRTAGTFRLPKLPSTQYHAFRMKTCVASGAALCKGNV